MPIPHKRMLSRLSPDARARVAKQASALILDEYIRSNAALFELVNHAIRQATYIRSTPMSDTVRNGMLDALIRTLSDGVERKSDDDIKELE